MRPGDLTSCPQVQPGWSCYRRRLLLRAGARRAAAWPCVAERFDDQRAACRSLWRDTSALRVRTWIAGSRQGGGRTEGQLRCRRRRRCQRWRAFVRTGSGPVQPAHQRRNSRCADADTCSAFWSLARPGACRDRLRSVIARAAAVLLTLWVLGCSGACRGGCGVGVGVFQVQYQRDPGEVQAGLQELGGTAEPVQVVLAVPTGAAAGTGGPEQPAALIQAQGPRHWPGQRAGLAGFAVPGCAVVRSADLSALAQRGRACPRRTAVPTGTTSPTTAAARPASSTAISRLRPTAR